MKYRSAFWLLSFGFHALAIVIAALLTVVIEMPGDDERDFALLVTPYEPGDGAWRLGMSEHDGDIGEGQERVRAVSAKRSEFWQPGDYVIPDGTEDDGSELHTTYLVRNTRSMDCTFKQPWPSDPSILAEVERRGKAAYRSQRCFTCH